MSVVAVMRTLMQSAADLPIPMAGLDAPLWGPAVGKVVTAPGGEFTPGDFVTHDRGWREYAADDVAGARRIDLEELPDVAAHLSQAMTGWLGVVRGAEVRAGDTVFVTGAAGGVGTMAGQFARLRGARRVTGRTGRTGRTGERLAELWTRTGDTTQARKARAGAADEYTVAGSVDDARRVRAADE